MFDRHTLSAVAAISCAVATALLPTGASAARGNAFDGSWKVQITTAQGACNSGVGFGVEVRNGVVVSPGAIDVRGSVAANGATRVTITAGNQSANGTGKLAGNVGSGTWRGVSTQGTCSGSWVATRR